ncbi:ATP-binding protein [Pseudenhygromyxa sp. WMMC2535]|uniref:ATP-binding protein n=1 Tax=Pseudenhygromyxa sp. WMMC2535 TaxID=2712867 RepID=UPI001552297C|nr:ATP-binding protein [Pseudenhygromyxa sp. WMMC2535]NVB40493.1 ATP-binding protein [Pseudenhygromyxa sp. WMMC2535]
MTPALSRPGCEHVREIRTISEARAAQTWALRLAEELGFERDAQWRIAISVSEAATNMVTHGGGGCLSLRGITEPHEGLRIEARDAGPGIDDPERAFQDHVSRGVDLREQPSNPRPRGLGAGLGAIRRLTDDCGWVNLEPGGLLWAEVYR